MVDRYWRGSTGNWNDTAHWATVSGGSGGNSVPTTGDVAIIDDHASGLNGGTLTINQNIDVLNIVWTNAVGTISNTGNFNITLAGGFYGNGSTARTWIGGTGNITLTAATATFNMATITGLTNPTTAFATNNIIFTGNMTLPSGGSANMLPGASMVFGSLQVSGPTTAKGGLAYAGNFAVTTLNSLTVSAGNVLKLQMDTTIKAFNVAGTAANPCVIANSGDPIAISVPAGAQTMDWVVLRTISFNLTGGATMAITNAVNAGITLPQTGLTFTPPSVGGGGGGSFGMVG